MKGLAEVPLTSEGDLAASGVAKNWHSEFQTHSAVPSHCTPSCDTLLLINQLKDK